MKRHEGSGERDLRRLFALDPVEGIRAPADGLDASAPLGARVLALLASVCLGAVLPVLMVVANKSAPATLGTAALFATLAAILGGRAGALKARYRAVLSGAGVFVVLGVVALSAVSFAWSVDRALTLRGLVEALPELVFALAAAAAWPLVARLRDAHWLLAGLAVAAALIAFERLGGMPLHALVHARREVWDLKRSAIPPVLMLWPAVAFCLFRGRPWAALGLFAAAIVGVVMAHSGAPGFAVIAGGFAFIAARRAPRFAVTVCAATLALVIVASAWTGTLATRFLPDRIENALSEQHAAHRVLIWNAFETRVRDRPILGHGFNASFKLAKAPRPGGRPPEADNVFLVDNHPHDVFLQFWVELGLLGGVAAAAVAAFVLRRIAAAPAATLPARLALLVTVVGVGLVGLSAWQPWWIATIATAMIWFNLLDERSRGVGPGR